MDAQQDFYSKYNNINKTFYRVCEYMAGGFFVCN